MRLALTITAALALAALAGCDYTPREPRLCTYYCGECHYWTDGGPDHPWGVSPCIQQPDGTCHYPPPWPDCGDAGR